MQTQPIDLAALAAMALLLGPTISFGLEQTVARWLTGWQMKAAAYAASFGAPLGAWLLALNNTPLPGMESLNSLPRDWHGLVDALIVGVFVAFGASLTNALVTKHLPDMKAESPTPAIVPATTIVSKPDSTPSDNLAANASSNPNANATEFMRLLAYYRAKAGHGAGAEDTITIRSISNLQNPGDSDAVREELVDSLVSFSAVTSTTP